MVNYQKYLFDNFVVKNDNLTDIQSDDSQLLEYNEEENVEYEDASFHGADDVTEKAFNEDVLAVDNIQETPTEQPQQFSQEYDYVPESVIEENMAVYTEEEYREAIEQAEKNAYEKCMEEAKNSSFEKQNLLLENIKNQLMNIYATLDEKQTQLEIAALNFSIEMVRKILPTLERERAETEVKSFLAENFVNFSNQDTLSFSFHPEIISSVADSISRLAEQNDFEGKISVHKDVSLGLSDCRVEWKSGGVERKTSDLINKVENLININNQERENG